MPINASKVSKLEIRVCTIVNETNINKLRKKNVYMSLLGQGLTSSYYKCLKKNHDAKFVKIDFNEENLMSRL